MSNPRNINDLPDEILMHIFSYITVTSLVHNVKDVCRRWKCLVEDPRLWKDLVYRPANSIFHSCSSVLSVLMEAPHLRYMRVPHGAEESLLTEVLLFSKNIRAFKVQMRQVRYELLERFVEMCKHLEELTIHDDNFGATQTLQIVSKCLKLERLVLVGTVSNVEHNVFIEISDGCPSLVGVDMKFLNGYKCDDLEYLLRKKSSKITSISLVCCSEWQGCSLPLIFKYCPNLESLDVSGHRGSVNFIEDFTPLMNLHLKTLCMTDFRCHYMKDILKYFENGPVQTLTKLDLSHFKVFDKKIANLIFERCINVKHLNLKACEELTDDCLELISNLKYLEYLNLDHCIEITDVGVEYIVKCRYLKYLVMNNCPLVTTKGFALCCENLRMLRHLLMENCIVNSEDLIRVPEKLTYLKKLRAFWKKMEMAAILAMLEKVEKMDLGNYDDRNPYYRYWE